MLRHDLNRVSGYYWVQFLFPVEKCQVDEDIEGLFKEKIVLFEVDFGQSDFIVLDKDLLH